MYLDRNSRVKSLLYNRLLLLMRFKHNKWWQLLWKKVTAGGLIRTTIHGFPVYIQSSYTYPFNARVYPYYNNPLLELTNSTIKAKKGPITILDIGAAVGDTFLLLKSNTPKNTIKKVYCLDGDKEFLELLNLNVGSFPEVKIISCMLSDKSDSRIKSLVRTHGGTASAQGEDTVSTRTLDEIVLEHHINDIDIIKLDIDGFDGDALAGGYNTIMTQHPNIIFEYHPLLIKQTGNDYFKGFNVLKEAGYTNYIWFSKYGRFTHFMQSPSMEDIQLYIDLCIRNNFDFDWHYDVIALSPSSAIDVYELAESQFSNNKVSVF